MLSTLETGLLAADVSKQTHDSIMAQIELPKSVANKFAETSSDKKVAAAPVSRSAAPAGSKHDCGFCC